MEVGTSFLLTVAILAINYQGCTADGIEIYKDGHQIEGKIVPGYGGVLNRIRCLADCGPGITPAVRWYKMTNGKQNIISTSVQRMYQVRTGSKRTAVLTFTKMFKSDEGSYICYAYINKKWHKKEINITFGCPGSHFSCDNGRCVDRKHMCDGTQQCTDGMDESVCGTCKAGEFECDGDCMPADVRCDGKIDCVDFTDEDSCHASVCGFGEIDCGGKCVPRNEPCNDHVFTDTYEEPEGVPAAPGIINFAGVKSRSVTARFETVLEGNAELKSVQLEYDDGNGTVKVITISEDLTNPMFAEITNLEPYTEYKVRVRVETDGGYSEYSVYQKVTTDVEGPSAPEIVILTTPSPTSVLVQWNPPNKLYRNIDSYLIKYWSLTDESWASEELVDGTEDTTTINNIPTNSQYKIKIAGITQSIVDEKRSFTGEFSDEVLFTLKGDCEADEIDCGDRCIPQGQQCEDTAGDCEEYQIDCGHTCIPHSEKCEDYSDYSDSACLDAEFSCGDRCISPEKICDNFADCIDRSDEDNCTGSTCQETEFTCGDRCISRAQICDNVTDCFDGSDEDNCTCSDGQFDCGGGYCINSTFECDVHEHCPDGSDEVNCAVCQGDLLFECNNGQCIPQSWRFDGVSDCFDGSDEITSNDPECLVTEFSCGDKCLSPAKICDSVTDCLDGSDEKNCTCSDGQFDCGRGNCIESSLQCDGEVHCPDGSDEVDCTKCSPGEFDCGNGECIPANLKCDMFPDCSNHMDEYTCTQGPASCPENLVMCTLPTGPRCINPTVEPCE